jgi:hypothetical protein
MNCPRKCLNVGERNFWTKETVDSCDSSSLFFYASLFFVRVFFVEYDCKYRMARCWALLSVSTWVYFLCFLFVLVLYLFLKFWDLDEQALLYEFADCVATRAFLKLVNLPFSIEQRPNAEHMSPNGVVPFLRLQSTLTPGFMNIVELVAQKVNILFLIALKC